jgi:hypothetical protein
MADEKNILGLEIEMVVVGLFNGGKHGARSLYSTETATEQLPSAAIRRCSRCGAGSHSLSNFKASELKGELAQLTNDSEGNVSEKTIS